MAKIPTPRFIRKPSGLIQLVYRYRSSKVVVSTRKHVNDPKDWNNDKKSKSYPYQRAIEQEDKPELSYVNHKLNELAGLCMAIYKENRYGGILPADFKKELEYRAGFKIRPKDKSNVTFFDFLEDYVKEREAEGMKNNSLRPLKLHAGNLRKFAQEEGIFSFDDIDFNFRKKYIQWMEKHCFSLGYGNKCLTNLKHFAEQAKQRGFHNNSKYLGRGWTVPAASHSGDKIALTEQEVNRLLELKLTGEKEKARDLTLIGIGTGQRHSDFSKYHPEQFRTTIKGIPLLEVYQGKTGTRAIIPLNIFSWLSPVLDKYGNTSPKLSQQKLNKLIKEICKEAGFNRRVMVVEQLIGMKAKVKKQRVELWQEVSSHCCRRSFATILYKQGHKPVLLMKFTGHKTESQFFEYIGIQAEQAAEEFGLMMQADHTSQPKLKAI